MRAPIFASVLCFSARIRSRKVSALNTGQKEAARRKGDRGGQSSKWLQLESSGVKLSLRNKTVCPVCLNICVANTVTNTAKDLLFSLWQWTFLLWLLFKSIIYNVSILSQARKRAICPIFYVLYVGWKDCLSPPYSFLSSTFIRSHQPHWWPI